MADDVPIHVPVLADEVVAHFGGLSDQVIVDCTVGLGGHAALLLEHNSSIRVIGLDVDEDNLATAGERLGAYGERVRLARANFADLDEVLEGLGVPQVGGVLAERGQQ